MSDTQKQNPEIELRPLCQRHEHDLIVKQLRLKPEDTWRAQYVVAQILMFQGASALDSIWKRCDGDIANMSLVLNEIGCLACWNRALYSLVVRTMKRGIDYAAAIGKGKWKDDADWSRWMAEREASS